MGLFEQTNYFNNWYENLGLFFFATLFVWSVVLAPLLLTLSTLRLWFSPLTVKERKKMHDIIEILVAWEYSEVFLFTLAITVWQMELSTENWVASICAPLDYYFTQLTHYGVIEQQDARCFTRIGYVGTSQYLLLASVIILYTLISFVTKASDQCMKETEESLPNRNIKEDDTSEDSDEWDTGDFDDVVNTKDVTAQFTDAFPFIFNV